MRRILVDVSLEGHRLGDWLHLPSLIDDAVLLTEPRFVEKIMLILWHDFAAHSIELQSETCFALEKVEGPHPNKCVAGQERTLRAF